MLSAKLEAYLYEKYELPAQQLRQQLRAGEQVVVTNAQGEIVYQNVPGQRPVIPTNAQLWFSRDGVDYYLVF
ncbi:MAG: hypothetical protein MUC97_10855 [Bernardetiaceae bacterium]|nr:hypothetical protein [Bernardetiaceae bacterium]